MLSKTKHKVSINTDFQHLNETSKQQETDAEFVNNIYFERAMLYWELPLYIYENRPNILLKRCYSL